MATFRDLPAVNVAPRIDPKTLVSATSVTPLGSALSGLTEGVLKGIELNRQREKMDQEKAYQDAKLGLAKQQEDRLRSGQEFEEELLFQNMLDQANKEMAEKKRKELEAQTLFDFLSKPQETTTLGPIGGEIQTLGMGAPKDLGAMVSPETTGVDLSQINMNDILSQQNTTGFPDGSMTLNNVSSVSPNQPLSFKEGGAATINTDVLGPMIPSVAQQTPLTNLDFARDLMEKGVPTDIVMSSLGQMNVKDAEKARSLWDMEGEKIKRNKIIAETQKLLNGKDFSNKSYAGSPIEKWAEAEREGNAMRLGVDENETPIYASIIRDDFGTVSAYIPTTGQYVTGLTEEEVRNKAQITYQEHLLSLLPETTIEPQLQKETSPVIDLPSEPKGRQRSTARGTRPTFESRFSDLTPSAQENTIGPIRGKIRSK